MSEARILARGHEPSQHNHCGTGTGWIDGVELCYACCDLHARIDMKRRHEKGEPFTAYLGDTFLNHQREVTTWSGGLLGRVISARVVRIAGYSVMHGTRLLAVTVRDVHGNEWWGRGSPTMAITLRPKRRKAKAA